MAAEVQMVGATGSNGGQSQHGRLTSNTGRSQVWLCAGDFDAMAVICSSVPLTPPTSGLVLLPMDAKMKSSPAGQLMSTSARLPDARIPCWIARGA